MFSHANIDVALRTRLLDPLRHLFKFHSNKEMSRGHISFVILHLTVIGLCRDVTASRDEIM